MGIMESCNCLLNLYGIHFKYLHLDINYYLDISQDPIGNWKQKSAMTVGRRAFGIGTDTGHQYIYILGGVAKGKQTLEDIEKYDPDLDEWISISAKLPYKSSVKSTQGENGDIWMVLLKWEQATWQRHLHLFNTDTESISAVNVTQIPPRKCILVLVQGTIIY